MRYKPAIVFLLLIKSHFVFGQDDEKILKIRKQFNEWQILLENENIEPEFYYHSVWGNNFENDAWTTFKPADSVAVIQIASVFSQPTLGGLITVDENSISGDWSIRTENYYDKNGNLFFIFWSMNTFQADQPVTVEKRLYFDNKRLLKKRKTVLRMNAREVVDAGFADREVTIWYSLSDIPFRE